MLRDRKVRSQSGSGYFAAWRINTFTFHMDLQVEIQIKRKANFAALRSGVNIPFSQYLSPKDFRET